MRSIALAELALKDDHCPICRGKRSKCTDEHLVPIIESIDVTCRDQEQIEKHRQAYHQQHRHTGPLDKCDACSDRHFYVAGYREVTDAADSQP